MEIKINYEKYIYIGSISYTSADSFQFEIRNTLDKAILHDLKPLPHNPNS